MAQYALSWKGDGSVQVISLYADTDSGRLWHELCIVLSMKRNGTLNREVKDMKQDKAIQQAIMNQKEILDMIENATEHNDDDGFQDKNGVYQDLYAMVNNTIHTLNDHAQDSPERDDIAG